MSDDLLKLAERLERASSREVDAMVRFDGSPTPKNAWLLIVARLRHLSAALRARSAA